MTRKSQSKGDGGIAACMTAGKSDCHSKYARGGKVDEMPDMNMDEHDEAKEMGDVDSELDDMVAEEAFEALKNDDKKAFAAAIKALVLNCKG